MTTYKTGRIITILARSPDDVIKNVFVATVQVKDEHFSIIMQDDKQRYLVHYQNKDSISIDGTQNTFVFLWNLTANAFTVNDYTFTVNENTVLSYELLQVHLNIGNYGSLEGLPSEGTISIAGLEEVDDVIGETNSTLEEATYLDRLSKLLQANNISASDIMDKIKTVEDKADKRLRQMCSAHEKSQCLNAVACKRDPKRSTFTCHCKNGYGGTFCQFYLLITYFGENDLVLTPLKQYLDWKSANKEDFYLHPEKADPLTQAKCAEFEKPGKLPIEQVHVQLPIWDAMFEPVYFNDTPVSVITVTPMEYDYVIIIIVILLVLFVTALILLLGYLLCASKFPNKKEAKTPKKNTTKTTHSFMPTRADLRKSQTPLLSESPSALLDQELQSNDAYSEPGDRRRLESPVPQFSTFRSLNSSDLIQPSSLPIIGEAADEICFADSE
uniref:EGF-like domain-containing protein n=1 Tax=Bursaphelenchus xylophilus TaxID=6326 RepID=A0A1I7S6Z5_BURXY